MRSDLHLLTGAYAAGALPPEDQAAFEEHLASCGPCAAEVRALAATAARLGAAEAAAPPPGARAEVLARIAGVRQVPPLPADAGQPADVVPLNRPRRTDPWRAVLGAAAAVALVAAMGLGAVVADLRGRAADLEARTGEVAAVLAAPDARTVSAAVGGGGRGAVVFSPALSRVVFLGTGLSQPPEGRTYQLWYVGPGGARSAGTMSLQGGGRAAEVLDGSPGDARTVALTIERAGGAAQPTMTPIFGVEVAGPAPQASASTRPA